MFVEFNGIDRGFVEGIEVVWSGWKAVKCGQKFLCE